MKGCVLGIDVGGTYTDCAIVDCRNHQVLDTAKALTSKPDCGRGLAKALAKLSPFVCSRIEEVHLAGTVTTNAIIEKWNDPVHLVMPEPAVLPPLPNCVPVFFQDIFKEDGGLGGLDSPAARETIAGLFEAKLILVASLQESGAERENLLGNFLRQRLGGLPVQIAGELSAAPSPQERLKSAYFATALGPIVQDWFSNVARTLEIYGIYAPVRYITSAAQLCEAGEMVCHPLQTILTGPVCSSLGSRFLTNLDNYLLADIGGTSTDITLMQDGHCCVGKNQVLIGDYQFVIPAAQMQSYGTGGDSLVSLNHRNEICVGPRQVASLSRVAARFPSVEEELCTYQKWPGYEMLNSCDTDCFWASDRRIDSLSLSEGDAEIIRFLKAEGCHSIWYLAERFGKDPDALNLFRLVKMGYLRAASLTPSDILCDTGRLHTGSARAAGLAIDRTAASMGVPKEEFVQRTLQAVENQLTVSCLQSTAFFERQSYTFNESRAARFLLDKFLNPEQRNLQARIRLQYPMVAVGAPAAAWMPRVAEKLETTVVIPKHFEVAGAIGAAVC